MIKQVESPQIQHSATRISSGRGQISYTILDLVVTAAMREKSTT